jgi:ApaG protein
VVKFDKYQILITVETQFIEENSMVEFNKYFFAYTVTIKNQGGQPAQLISRHWIIENANNEIFEVKGQGVIGEQPIIQPEESFIYTSGTEIDTPVGSMHGTYQMMTEDVKSFNATIPKFELRMPRTLH